MATKRKRASTKGLRRRTDKRGRKFWIDRFGRRAKPGAKLKPKPRRDKATGQLRSRKRPKVPKTYLPRVRVKGRFVKHPMRELVDAVHEARLTPTEFIERAKALIGYTPPAGEGLDEDEDDEDGDGGSDGDDGDDGDQGSSDGDYSRDQDAWLSHAEFEDMTEEEVEREAWEIYDQVYG